MKNILKNIWTKAGVLEDPIPQYLFPIPGLRGIIIFIILLFHLPYYLLLLLIIHENLHTYKHMPG